jgi:hypothetical protein
MLKVDARGFVLFATLMMLVVISMLVLSLSRMLLLSLKADTAWQLQQEKIHHVEDMALQLLGREKNAACTVYQLTPNDVIARLTEGQGCAVEAHQQRFRYLVDDLGAFSCLQMLVAKERYSSHHGLITVLLEASRPLILQLRYAKPAKLLPCPLVKIRWISQGILSWRYLDNKDKQ